MKTLTEIKSILASEKTNLSKRFGVVEICVFGSYVRDQQNSESDIDILVDFGDSPKVDLFDVVELEYHLSDLLGEPVDLAIKSSLRKRIGKRILDEAEPV